MNAPVCVAKGVDLIARKIREVAEAHDIPVIENPPLGPRLARYGRDRPGNSAGALPRGGRNHRLHHAAAPHRSRAGLIGTLLRSPCANAACAHGPARGTTRASLPARFPPKLAMRRCCADDCADGCADYCADDAPRTAPASARRIDEHPALPRVPPAPRARRSIAAPARARAGSVILVLLVAAILVAAATGFVVLGRDNAEPYILGFLAVLATVGVFSLFALASRHPAAARRREPANPLIKSIVDDAFDGILVTDGDGRVIYANAAYLDLIDASDANDMRPVERVFIGDADASEAIYRLLKAAREGKRLQEEVRVAGHQGPAGALAAAARAAARRTAGATARLTVWSLADVTRERERQENVFQELQHADRLSRSRAGRLFLRRCQGRRRLSQRHAGQLARSGSRAGRLRRAQACRPGRRRRRRAADDAARARRARSRPRCSISI